MRLTAMEDNGWLNAGSSSLSDLLTALGGRLST